jgi:hypothetical protein
MCLPYTTFLFIIRPHSRSWSFPTFHKSGHVWKYLHCTEAQRLGSITNSGTGSHNPVLHCLKSNLTSPERTNDSLLGLSWLLTSSLSLKYSVAMMGGVKSHVWWPRVPWPPHHWVRGTVMQDCLNFLVFSQVNWKIQLGENSPHLASLLSTAKVFIFHLVEEICVGLTTIWLLSCPPESLTGAPYQMAIGKMQMLVSALLSWAYPGWNQYSLLHITQAHDFMPGPLFLYTDTIILLSNHFSALVTSREQIASSME